MRILVTGGAGFIGSDLVRSLTRDGCGISVVDKLNYAGDLRRLEEARDRINFYQLDITDEKGLREVFEKEKPEVVVHYAAETHVDRSILDPDVFVKANVIGTLNLLKLSLKHGVRKFVHISTDEVYGELPLDSESKFTEDSPLQPNSPYSASKTSAEMLVRSFVETYDLPAVIVRASNAYGPWQYPEKLIPLSIARLLSDEKISVYGTGQNVRTWLFVEDFTEAVLKIIEKGEKGEIYNVGSAEEKKNIEVVRKLLELLDKSEDFIEFVPDRPGHDLRYAVDTTKIERELGWRAKVDFEEGMRRTVEWYLDNRDWLFEKKKEVETFVNQLRKEFERWASR
ncbi:dTDP-glucose 4,6-dehydratase [Thermosulfurimonas dismutans]|uniref:dTDP-glucose 4,6-dehydratase n=1 Tax=Thermosulfurimonas dismutans TaxID=999894 RepID=A0A179D1C8_9BACT|nr:dTDP-glucose 4,6-dehydratase [Thermosulfurimonas dismutans]OAQ19864.1 dTDP-glucose 4,6-dehydratase [Thermosulfurimonas dismutans]